MTVKDNASLRTECQRSSDFYRSKFPDIPFISSTDLIREQSQRTNDASILLVDVRTQAERNVSIIPNSISLAEFHKLMSENKPNTEPPSSLPFSSVVTYCTIGYRSGMEARRLRDQYSLTDIKNLDGIISYTHACSSSGLSDDNQVTSLIDPGTKEATDEVHTFGPSWNFVHSSYNAKFFSQWKLCWITLQVGFVTLLRKIQRCCSKREITTSKKMS